MKYFLIIAIGMSLIASKAHAVTFGSLVPTVDFKSLDSAPVAVDDRPVVFVYTAPFFCKPCNDLKVELHKMPEVNFVFKAPPEWIEGFPTLHWTGSDGIEYQNSGPYSVFKQKYFKTTQAVVDKHTKLKERYWTINGSRSLSRSTLINHLSNDGIHRGKFSRSYLESRTTGELDILHSNDHEEDNTQPVTQARTPRRRRLFSRRCPTGRCPN